MNHDSKEKDHFFNGICVCPKSCCTEHKGNMIRCICTTCPPNLCGLVSSRLVVEVR